MNVVGVDVGAYEHVAAVCREGAREAERAVIRFKSRRQGFEQFERWLGEQGEVGLVVMESSGHYWQNLTCHLRGRGQRVAVVNPLEAKYFAKSRLQRSKSDPADARTLAALGMRDQPPVRQTLANWELKEAARFAMHLVEEQGRICNKIQRLVDLGFPELREAFDDPTCVSALNVLRQAPTASAARRRRPATLARAVRPGGGRALGHAKAEQVRRLAQESVAAAELQAQVGFEMELLIQQHDLLEAQIREAEQRVGRLLDGDLARRLQTIPGVGPSLAATFIAEIGDIWRFDDFDQLAAYAGVHPKEFSSGRRGSDPQTSWKMAKTGNAYLRTAAYRLAVVGIQHNPLIREHYLRKRAQGKSKMNAVGHCMGKALAIVWGVWRGGSTFDPSGRPA